MNSQESLEAIPLSALLAGAQGQIHSIVGDSELLRRLAEIGLQPGTCLEMVRPGNTCILRVNGSKLCVRGDKLLRVLVTPIPAARLSA